MDGRKGRGELCRVWEEFCGLSLPSLPNSLAGSDRALALPQNKHLPVSTLYSTKLYCFILLCQFHDISTLYRSKHTQTLVPFVGEFPVWPRGRRVSLVRH